MVNLFSFLFSVVVASEPTQIRIAFPSVGTLVSGQVGVTLQHRDFLKSNNFAPEITSMPLGKELKQAMVAGQVDVIFTSEANFVVLLGQGFDCTAIGSLGEGGQMALVVKPDSKINEIKNLRGKKLATIFGTSLHKPAVEWVRESGLNPAKDLTIINMRGMGPMNAAFSVGDVDALITFDPYLYQGMKSKSYKILKSSPLDLIVVMSNKYIQKNPGVIERFNETVRQATFYMATHKSEVNGWASQMSQTPVEVLDGASQINRNYNAKTLSDVDVTISPAFRQKLFEMNEFLFKEKLISKKADIAAHIYSKANL